jgi:hypothetical protein
MCYYALQISATKYGKGDMILSNTNIRNTINMDKYWLPYLIIILVVSGISVYTELKFGEVLPKMGSCNVECTEWRMRYTVN